MITQTLTVKPTWQPYHPQDQETVLEIDPGMAFGTGTHATTALCIRMIEAYLKQGDRFLDVGTGSGIQMVASAKLGASRVWGTDIDTLAVEIARNNLLLNQIEPDRFQVLAADLIRGVKGQFDLVSANILSEIILILLKDVHRIIKPGGMLICSGIIEKNKPAVVEKMMEKGFQIIETLSREEWVAIAGRYQ